MTTTNLLWPRWAKLAAHLPWKTAEARGFRCQWLIRKTGALLANRYGRKQSARSARLMWETLYSMPRLRELWARPRRMIRTLLGLALALGLSSPAAADRKAEEIALVTASAADIVTTELWLFHGQFTVDGVIYRPIETGAVLKHIESPAGRIAVKAASTAGMLYFARFMERKGHPRVASIMRLSGVMVWGTAAGWNVGLVVRY